MRLLSIRQIRNSGFYRLPAICILVALAFSCGVELPDEVAEAYQKTPQDLDFNIHVKPILSDRCFLCHGPDNNKREAGLRLDVPENAYAELPESPGKYAIAPGKAAQSELFHRIFSDDPNSLMPPPESKLPLTAYEKAVLVKWLKQGAKYQPHWAFLKPQKTKPPVVKDKQWGLNPIDRFVWQELAKRELKPSPEAEKELLLRRLSFDLIGLPPDTKEIRAFLEDKSENAYEKQVDRLLASPHYGEKMAMDWMDLARFADTHGYLADRYRDMSPWRDWVIKAFNENLPYDDFVTWQLAGDLLPNASREQILATGFNRLHPQNLEDGIVDEEFRVAYVSDRTDVLGQGLMGLTLACAKCHDHKYDPISQKNYYELFSFFNNINESGLISWEGATPVPTLMIPSREQEEILDFLEKAVVQQESVVGRTIVAETPTMEDWIKKEAYKSIPIQKQPTGLIAHFELENPSLVNRLNPAQRGKMDQKSSNNERPEFAEGKQGKGLSLDGDAWLDLGKIGIFKRNQPFSIGLQIWLPKDLKNGYFFHKGMGTRLHSFRGYHLYLKENKLELMMAHTWPDNAVVEYAKVEIPRKEWVQLTVTYDGSSKASGYKLYLNGQELETEVEIDQLYKDIIFHDMVDPIYAGSVEPGLQIGARWRGKGLSGAIVDDVLVFDRELSALEVMQIAAPDLLEQIRSKKKEALSKEDLQYLSQYYLFNYVRDYQKAIEELEKLREVYVDGMENVQEVMVMKEMPKRRPAYVLERGRYDVRGEEVYPNTPEAILPMPEGLPKNRLGLAQWLTNPDHPLTARVAVNRYWQNFFGRGLVKTTEDFGSQGELPSHPDLLDWLAVNFIESGWDVKALIKRIVTSAAYRQDSKMNDQSYKADPENIWLSRGPALRLTSEMIRDNALFASGLLNKKIGGESVKPYQPEGLWKMNNATYTPDSGNKLYRRSLYTIWKRSVPHPVLATFDAPDRSECTVRRQKTNTPLQALVTLNAPTFLEASKVLGEQITQAENTEQAIIETFVKLTGRKPSGEETTILQNLQKKEYEAFKAQPGKSKGWLLAGAYVPDARLDPDQLAANAVLASVIMNADVTLTKR